MFRQTKVDTMELQDMLQQFNLREVDVQRSRSNDNYIKKGHEISDFLTWHKFVSAENGMGIFVEIYQKDNGAGRVELLFPTAFEKRYWQTVEKLGEIAGISFEEIKTGQPKEEQRQYWSQNYDYMFQVTELYAAVLGRVAFILKKTLAKSGMAFEEQNDLFRDTKVDYTDLTCANKEKLILGENLLLHCRALNVMFKKFEIIAKYLGVFAQITEATQEDWQKIESGILGYARHLRDLYRPILPARPIL